MLEMHLQLSTTHLLIQFQEIEHLISNMFNRIKWIIIRIPTKLQEICTMIFKDKLTSKCPISIGRVFQVVLKIIVSIRRVNTVSNLTIQLGEIVNICIMKLFDQESYPYSPPLFIISSIRLVRKKNKEECMNFKIQMLFLVDLQPYSKRSSIHYKSQRVDRLTI